MEYHSPEAATASHRREAAAMPVLRSRRGRWLAGMCAGLGRGSRSRAAWMRAGFVAASLVGGLGPLVYAACWLIVPLDGSAQDDANASRTVVGLAQVCAAAAGLLIIGAIAAAATVFGFGWVVLALGAALLVAVLATWPRIGPVWAVLPLIALAIPSAAVAAYGLRLAPRMGPLVVRPHDLRAASYQHQGASAIRGASARLGPPDACTRAASGRRPGSRNTPGPTSGACAARVDGGRGGAT